MSSSVEMANVVSLLLGTLDIKLKMPWQWKQKQCKIISGLKSTNVHVLVHAEAFNTFCFSMMAVVKVLFPHHIYGRAREVLL